MTSENSPEEESAQGFTVPPTGMMEQVQSEPTPIHDVLKEEKSRYELMDAIAERQGGEKAPFDPAEAEGGTPILETSEPILEPMEPKPMQKVTICRMVEYRSRTGNYTVPAVVNCTSDSIYQPGVEHGFVPPLSSPNHVHLTVFSPGRPGMRAAGADGNLVAGAENFVVTSPYPVSENVSGCYQEWDIDYDPDGSPGTWRWPARV